MTDKAYSWDDWKTAEQSSGTFVLPPEDSGYVLRIDFMGDPRPSTFIFKDEDGNDLPPKIQARFSFTIVDYVNDDPGPDGTKSVIGQRVDHYFSMSMHTKSTFYKLVKAAFGGEVDPRWKPNKPDLQGKLVGAVIGHKKPNAEGYVYPKIDNFLVYRGRRTDFSDVPVYQPSDNAAAGGTKEDYSDVPF